MAIITIPMTITAMPSPRSRPLARLAQPTAMIMADSSKNPNHGIRSVKTDPELRITSGVGHGTRRAESGANRQNRWDRPAGLSTRRLLTWAAGQAPVSGTPPR